MVRAINYYSILLTEDCNLKCKHCYQGLNKKKKYMSIETFNSLNLNYEEDHIQLYGGEPTLNKELYNYILSKNIKHLSMITNSSKILKDEEVKKFKHIHFSLNDGTFYYNVVNNIKKCILHGIDFTINLIISDFTIDITNTFVNEYYEFSKNFYFINDFDVNITDSTIKKFLNTYEFYLDKLFKIYKEENGVFRDKFEIRRHVLEKPVLCLSKEYEKKDIIVLTNGEKCSCHQAYVSKLENKIKNDEIKINQKSLIECRFCSVGCTFCGCSEKRLDENNTVTIPRQICELNKIKDNLFKIRYIEYLEDLLNQKKEFKK